MKLNRRHLIGSLILLAASIVWNVWAFTKPSATERRLGSSGAVAPGAAAAAGVAAVDPASIPPPPPLDLTAAPVWTRSPFARGNSAPRGAVPAAEITAPPADPVVSAILFSEGSRRYAMVDGRIVGIGERAGDGIVSDIERDAIVVQLASGERRRLPLNAQRPARERAK